MGCVTFRGQVSLWLRRRGSISLPLASVWKVSPDLRWVRYLPPDKAVSLLVLLYQALLEAGPHSSRCSLLQLHGHTSSAGSHPVCPHVALLLQRAIGISRAHVCHEMIGLL